MRRLPLALLAVLMLSPASARPSANAQEPLAVRGTLRGCDGRPLQGAYASLQGQDVVFRHTTDANGRFSFSVDEEGVYWLWLAGIHHKTLLMPLLVTESIEFDVRLGGPEYETDVDSVYVIGEFNGFSVDEGGILMNPQPDGTYTAVIETSADTLGYQLVGVQRRETPLAGTHADRYVLDRKRPFVSGRAGKYVSVVSVENRKATIKFDPVELPHCEGEEAVVFEDLNGAAAQIVEARERLAAHKRRYREARDEHRKTGGDPTKFEYDWSTVKTAVLQRLDSDQHELTRHYLLLQYFHFGSAEADSLIARRILNVVSPTSLAWSLEWGSALNTFHTIARISNRPRAVRSYAEQALEGHSDPEVRAAFLFYALGLAHGAGEADIAGRYYTRLMDEFGDSMFARMATARFDPGRNIQTGRPVPDFTFTSMDDSTKTVTPQKLRDRVYLIDFWATWCGPCVAEMETLHEVYDEYKDNGFTILSVSFDRDPTHVAKFRRKKWPMPWFNVFLEEGFHGDAAKAFEVVGIPKPILVGKDGTIVATPDELRGDALERTLSRVIEGTKTSQ